VNDVDLSAGVSGRTEQNGATDHVALLRTATGESSTRIENWVRSARARGDHVVTVAVPDGFTPGTEGLPVVAPVELHPDGRPAEVVRRALDAGHGGLGVLVHADAVIAAMSATVHTEIEDVLAALCRDHPVSVLCVYDRDGAGRDHLDMAAARHPDRILETQADLRRTGQTMWLRGEFDTTNNDVLGAALRSAAREAPAALSINVSGVGFLSVAAARTLALNGAEHGQHGGRVELRGAPTHVQNVLRLFLRQDGEPHGR
jgi:anti-anti-sigma regulatory factor